MAVKIENSTSVDNSWSSTITAVAILVMAIMVWLMFRVYNKYCGLHPPASHAQAAVVLDMEQLLNVVAHRPVPTLTSNIQAAGPQPPSALFFNKAT